MAQANTILPEDLRLSGPHVWPDLSAEQTVDRYIQRRPELAYLRALRRVLAGEKGRTDLAPAIQVVSARLRTLPGNRQGQIHLGDFLHLTTLDDRQADVRGMLRSLRRLLLRQMPPEPLLGTRVSLLFRYDDKIMARYQAEWL